MSLFYNRDRNITGFVDLTELNIQPSYGSTVSFSTRASEIKYPNRVLRRMGQSLNSVKAEFNLLFGADDSRTSELINYFESRSGVLPISFSDSSNIYQSITGFIDEFSWNPRSRVLNEVSAKITVDNRSPQLNWSGLAFTKTNFQQWKTGESVPKYGIRYFEANPDNKFLNYFYCTGDHVSSVENAPFSTGSMWTQKIFLDESIDYSISTAPDVSRIEFSNSFPQRVKDKKNIHSIEGLTLKFNSLSDEQTRAILHFLETKFGELKFEYQIPKVYNRPKIFYAPSWRHTWVYKNTNSVEIDLVEDSLGVLPQGNFPAIRISQSSGQIKFSAFLESANDFCLINYNGGEKNVVSGGNFEKTWQGNPETIGLFGGLTGVSFSNQNVDFVDFAENSTIKKASLSRNLIKNAKISSARKLEYLDLSYNSLSELDITNAKSLRSLDLRSNRISSLDVSTNENLTGFYLSGNKIGSSELSGCLDAFVNFGKKSGVFDCADNSYQDFETNGSLSGSMFTNAAILGWRGWTLKFDNATVPYDPSILGSPVLTFNQENITGQNDGDYIFSWNEPLGNFNASRFVVTDSARPRLDFNQVNSRPALYFNGISYLEQTKFANLPTSYSIFAVVKPLDSGVMSVFSDNWNRGLFVSGNRLMNKTNMGSSLFGELSGNFYNVVGLVNDGTTVSGAVNSQTPVSGNSKMGTSNLVLPGVVGANKYGASGVLTATVSGNHPHPYKGYISEVVIYTGSVNFSQMMRDLGAKHGLEIV